MMVCSDDTNMSKWADGKYAHLQARKQNLEEKLSARTQELRKLCIQEAELTGIMPSEMPLEPGESPPLFRRRVGTAFAYPQNLINKLPTKEKESIAALELEQQVQAGISEAALGLINNSMASKAIRRQNRVVYQQSQRKLRELEERLSFLSASRSSSRVSHQHHDPTMYHNKNKKKSASPVDPESGFPIRDNISGHSDSIEHISHTWHVKQNERLERFGSLDRSKARPLQEKWNSSGIIDNLTVHKKTAAHVSERIEERLPPLQHHHHHTLQYPNTHHDLTAAEQSNRWHLIRTHSMGSVDVSALEDIVYSRKPSTRKHKQKKWYETSLDEPDQSMSKSPSSHSMVQTGGHSHQMQMHLNQPHSHSVHNINQVPIHNVHNMNQLSPIHITNQHTMYNMPVHTQNQQPPSVVSYPAVHHSYSPVTSSHHARPAPSKPLPLPPEVSEIDSPISNSDISMTNFNNASMTVPVQSPKNCTVVEPGQWKPYREITKPFEMSDFYKYSTKFKNRQSSGGTSEKDVNRNSNVPSVDEVARLPNRNDRVMSTDNGYDDPEAASSHSPLLQKGIYQPLQPMKCQPYNSYSYV